MERKWINPKNKEQWTIYRDLYGKIEHISSTIPTQWRDTAFDNWIEIEQAQKARNYEEDLNYISNTIQKRTGFQQTAAEIKAVFAGTALRALENIHFPTQNIKLNYCIHEWTTYTGFMKVETYCTKCNEVQK